MVRMRATLRGTCHTHGWGTEELEAAHDAHLQGGKVDEERLVLLAGLGDHVEQQVRHFDGRDGVAAHGRHHHQLLLGWVVHHQLRHLADALRCRHARAAKLVHLHRMRHSIRICPVHI